ncbi:TPA: hypothetical protein HA351_01220 [Methanosarcinaceae archaeon]|nr:hypothetical protein [Methanosarcinaceae archaeon]
MESVRSSVSRVVFSIELSGETLEGKALLIVYSSDDCKASARSVEIVYL